MFRGTALSSAGVVRYAAWPTSVVLAEGPPGGSVDIAVDVTLAATKQFVCEYQREKETTNRLRGKDLHGL
jgi:hypothetical protein